MSKEAKALHRFNVLNQKYIERIKHILQAKRMKKVADVIFGKKRR